MSSSGFFIQVLLFVASFVPISSLSLPQNGMPFAQDALLSPRMAQKVRRFRSNRGKTPCIVQVEEPQTENMEGQKVSHDAGHSRRINGFDLSYEVTLAALHAYHVKHGHLILPRRYQVPVNDEGYPVEWRGLDLASTVYNMKWWLIHVKQRPERVAELNALSFCWERLQPEFNLVLEAIMEFREIYGHLLVPHKFVVPSEKEWPRATWGLALGSCVYRIRARNDFLRGAQGASRREQLDRLGFCWDVYESRFRTFYFALTHFSRLEQCGAFSNCGRMKALRVPTSFCVPSGDERWPQYLWGYPLGAKCTAVRQKQLYIKDKSERQRLLAELGFRFTGNADLGWLKVVHAAAIFSRMHGRILDVPLNFVVPEPPPGQHDLEDWPWPEHLWGLRLGQRLKDVRVKGAYVSGSNADDRRRQLDALGFNWKPRRGRRRLKR